MRHRLPLAWVAALAFLLGNGLVYAQSPTNNPVTLLQQSDAWVRRLREIYGEVVRLEEQAPADQTMMVDCIRSRVLKIKGLLELAEDTRKDIQLAVGATESKKAGEDVGDAKNSCARAEKLLLEARECAVSNAPLPATPDTNVTSNAKITPRSPWPAIKQRFVERSPKTCLRHVEFAAWLARAMDLKLEPHATPSDCANALAKLNVEPLGGWRPGQCVTVDDVYVACARAMNLKVKDPADPLSYGQALREEGLGVDTLLPERDPKQDPPFVLDSEGRAFLTSGYAAPLPSAKHLAPD